MLRNKRGVADWIFNHEKNIVQVVISAYAYGSLELAVAEFENNIELINDSNIRNIVQSYSEASGYFVAFIIDKAKATSRTERKFIKISEKGKQKRVSEIKAQRKSRKRKIKEIYLRGKRKVEQTVYRDARTGRFRSKIIRRK